MARSVYRHVQDVLVRNAERDPVRLGCVLLDSPDGEWILEGEDAIPVLAVFDAIEDAIDGRGRVVEFLRAHSALARRLGPTVLGYPNFPTMPIFTRRPF